MASKSDVFPNMEEYSLNSQKTDAIFSCCPVGCDSTLKNTSISLPEGYLKQCPECKQLLSPCSKTWFDESMQEFNVAEGTLPTEQNKPRYHRRMGKILRQAKNALTYQTKSPRLLDVGCSSGALLLVAKECGYEAHGAEPAEKAADTAKSLGFDVFPGYLQDAHFPDNHFDVITLFEVIEHLIEPATLLHEILRILKPGGVLLVGTGNGDSWTVNFLQNKWEYFDIRSHGGHISFFNPKSMATLATACGFEVKNISTKRVNLAERKDVSPPVFEISKIVRELLEIPARCCNKGHDMLAILGKPEQ